MRLGERARLLAVVVLCSLGRLAAHQAQNLYFTSTDNIQAYMPNSSEARIVINNLDHPQALACNLCDRKIYWINLFGGKIRRGSPMSGGAIEDIITQDISYPHGIAVDYIGNNVYFSQRTDVQERGRLEVTTCDGRYRRVLKTGLREAGPLALDITRGYLYYVDAHCIYRMHTDGSNDVCLIDTADEGLDPINGLAIDVSENTLFWSHQNIVYTKSPPDATGSPQEIDPGDSIPFGLAASNRKLYWTQVGNSSANIPGAIYSYDITSGERAILYSNSTIEPLDISSSLFGEDVSLPTEGCADNNGGCNRFCFSVPSGTGTGTVPKCDCPTGIVLEEDGQTCAIVPNNFILFGRTQVSGQSEIHMISLDTDNHINVALPVQVSGTGAHFIAYDETDHMVYWDETTPPSIRRAPIDSNEEAELFIWTDIRYVSGIAVDTFSRNLYWVDSVLDRIEVAYMGGRGVGGIHDGGVRRVIVSGNLHQPQGLALDLVRGFMYWVDLDSHSPRVETARLDGSQRQVVDTDENIQQPSAIAVDQQTGDVYWADSGRELSEGPVVRYRPSTGETEDPFVRSQFIHGLAVLGSTLYWTDGEGSVKSSRGAESEILVDHVLGVQGIAAVNISFHVDSPCEHTIHHQVGCSHLCLPQSTTEGVCACPDGYVFEEGSSERCENSTAHAFLATRPSSPLPELSSYVAPGEVTRGWSEVSHRVGGFPIAAMAIDLTTSSIYYISSEDQLIYSRHWNATTYELIQEKATPIITCCLATPEDLAVDWMGRNLYWSDSERGVIEASRLDGSGRRIIASGLDQPSLIELYPRRPHGYIYLVSKSSNAIYRIRMDGSTNTTALIPFYPTLQDVADSDSIITGISINFSPDFQDCILWSYSIPDGSGGQKTKVRSISLTDPEPTSILEHSPDGFQYHAFTAFNNSIYFAYVVWGSVFVDRRLNGNDYTVVEESDEMSVVGISIAHPLGQPGVHECAHICNGYNPVCLVEDHIFGSCHCPPNAFKVTGYDPFLVERDSCIKSNSFLLWATPSSIYMYALPSNLSNPKMTSVPQLLPIGRVGEVAGVTYDPRNESVVWLDGETNYLHSVSVDGTQSHVLGQLPDIHPDSMSLDWIGGQVFFTEDRGFQIEAASVRGDGVRVGSVMSAYGQEMGIINDLYKPLDVQFDETTTTLYWNGGNQEVFKMSLQNIGSRTPLGVAKETRSISHLSLDPESQWVYWVNGEEGLVEGKPLGGGEVMAFADNAYNIAAMTATTISPTTDTSTGYIFWYNETDKSLYHCNTSRALAGESCPQRQLQLETEERVVAFVSFDQSRLLSLSLPYRCRDTQDCDYLCVENLMGGAHCTCPLYREPLGEGSCSDIISCGVHQWPCNDALECYPFAYFCDGIDHCTNGEDESNCTCDNPSHRRCSKSATCYPNSSRCDSINDCPLAEDESLCCRASEFGCYTPASVYMCFQEQMRCGSVPVCMNEEDQQDCPPSDPTSTSTSTPSSSSSSNIGIIVGIIAVFTFVVILFFVVVVYVTIRISKRNYTTRHRAVYKVDGTSPTPRSRSDSTSVYSAGMSSLGTESTNFGNCSSPHTDSFCKPFGLHTEPSHQLSNPPPSLITGRHSQAFEEEMASIVMSECDPCPAPAPSVNWENMSTMSYSASQRGVRGGAINGGLEHYHHSGGNPLHYHHHHPGQQNGYPYTNRGPHFHRVGRLPNHYRGPGYDLAETETMFSQSTINTESHSVFQYEDRTPPGRPPSPATITEYSERRVPLTPTSRISEYSDEDLRED